LKKFIFTHEFHHFKKNFFKVQERNLCVKTNFSKFRDKNNAFALFLTPCFKLFLGKREKRLIKTKLLSFSSPYLCPPESITLNHGSIFVYTTMTRHSDPDLVSDASALKSLSQDHHLRNKRCCLSSGVGCSNQIDVGD
jgi:hypothetical protein